MASVLCMPAVKHHILRRLCFMYEAAAASSRQRTGLAGDADWLGHGVVRCAPAPSAPNAVTTCDGQHRGGFMWYASAFTVIHPHFHL